MSIPKIAFITGLGGQDGSYLAELLLSKNYHVHGLLRTSSIPKLDRIQHIVNNQKLTIHYGDVSDFANILGILQKVQPDEIYHLAAQSHVHVSFNQPMYTLQVDTSGTLNILEAIRLSKLTSCKFYNAATSEMMGKVQEIPQTEKTPFYPRSPYACAKLCAFWLTKNYRESYNMFACNGILFNHESPRRGAEFVTRKITKAIAKIVCEQQETLFLGNLDAQRDWGHSKDYVNAMWMILQAENPDDFVIATGKTMSVREFATRAFREAGIELKWEGKGLDEIGIDCKTNKVRVRVDKQYYRPAEVDLLIGDASKAKQILGWEPKISLDELIREMVKADITTSLTTKSLNI